MTAFTMEDFAIKKRASGWSVVRRDGALIAIGFRTKSAAAEWWAEQSGRVASEA